MRFRIGIGQINTIIGDFTGNTAKIVDYAKRAKSQGADLIVFPEMCVCGYPPMDLLDHNYFVEANLKTFRRIQKDSPRDIALVVGYVERNRNSGKGLLNTAALIYNSEILLSQAKTLLPSYDVFDETRYFEPAHKRKVVSFRGERIGLAVCEDIWWKADPGFSDLYTVDPVKDLLNLGATLILVPSASPYYAGKPEIRKDLLARIGKSSGIPVIYSNAVGGNDSLIFDGRSMITSKEGQLTFLGEAFKEQLAVVDIANSRENIPLHIDLWKEVEEALILGLKDYVEKCNFKRVHVSLSGGIDSSVVTALAVKALGPENVTAIALPSRYSSEGSLADAQKLASNLGIKIEKLSIEEVFKACLATLEPVFEGLKEDITEENLQARIRGILVMAYSNKCNSLLLATGNKSELATGYCTLYGDMCGGLAVIGDLLKTEVYSLAESLNRDREIIPETILTKAPSAELKPDQTDQDSLPPYDLLDKILEMHLIMSMSLEAITEKGFDEKLVSRVLNLVERAEYKRRQAPPVLKVSSRAFGTGRRIPIARKF